MPEKSKPQTPQSAWQPVDESAWQSVDEGQGSSPNYGKDVTVVNPTMGQVGKGTLREGAKLLSGAHSIGRQGLELIPGVKDSSFGKSMEQHQAQLDELARPRNMGEAMGQTGAEMASYLLPAKAESSALEATENLPRLLRPAARIAIPSLSAGTMSTLNREPFSAGAIAGGATGALGEVGRTIAPSLVRSAAPGMSRESAKSLLKETSGIRPSTIGKNLDTRIGELGKDLDTAVGGQQQTPSISMQRAEDPIVEAYLTASRQRVPENKAQLENMMKFIRGTDEFGPPRPPLLTPRDALDARRGFSENFVGNRGWKQVANPAPLAAAKQGYGGITGALHEAVPGAIPIDEKLSALSGARTPIRSLVQRDPGLVENVAGRVGARTGALTGAALGAAGGAKKGLGGAILGGATGLILPEVLSTPTAKFAAARALASPITERLGRAVTVPAVEKLIEGIRKSGRGDLEK